MNGRILGMGLAVCFFGPQSALGVGNGQGYNGPHLSGDSIPAEVDHLMDSRDLEMVTGECLQSLSYSLVAEFFGDRMEHMKSIAAGGTKQSPDQPGAFWTQMRELVVFQPVYGGPIWHFNIPVTVGLSEPRPLTDKYSAFSLAVEPNSSRFTRLEPEKREGSLWLGLPQGLPKVIFVSPGPLPSGTNLVPGDPLRVLGVEPSSKDGIAEPLIDNYTHRPSVATINTVDFGQCLQTSTLDVESGFPLSPQAAYRVPEPGGNPFVNAFLTPVYALPELTQKNSTLAERSHRQELHWNLLKEAADRIRDAYFAGRWNNEYAAGWDNWCGDLAGEHDPRESFDCERLHALLSNEFYDSSMKKLESWSHAIPQLARLLARIEKRPYPKFRLGLELNKGGYHRAESYIALSLNDIPPNEWMIDFIHELIHSVDPKLGEASLAFGNLRTAHEKSPGDSSLTARWLAAGLDRGLLAEWRAWTVTLAIYRAGVTKKFWQPLADLDQIGTRFSSASLADSVFQFLDRNFTDPEAQEFQTDSVVEQLIQIRHRLRTDPASRALGALGKLL